MEFEVGQELIVQLPASGQQIIGTWDGAHLQIRSSIPLSLGSEITDTSSNNLFPDDPLLNETAHGLMLTPSKRPFTSTITTRLEEMYEESLSRIRQLQQQTSQLQQQNTELQRKNDTLRQDVVAVHKAAKVELHACQKQIARLTTQNHRLRAALLSSRMELKKNSPESSSSQPDSNCPRTANMRSPDGSQHNRMTSSPEDAAHNRQNHDSSSQKQQPEISPIHKYNSRIKENNASDNISLLSTSTTGLDSTLGRIPGSTNTRDSVILDMTHQTKTSVLLTGQESESPEQPFSGSVQQLHPIISCILHTHSSPGDPESRRQEPIIRVEDECSLESTSVSPNRGASDSHVLLSPVSRSGPRGSESRNCFDTFKKIIDDLKVSPSDKAKSDDSTKPDSDTYNVEDIMVEAQMSEKSPRQTTGVKRDLVPAKMKDQVVDDDVIPVKVMDKVVQGDVIPVNMKDKVVQGDVIPVKVVDKVVQGDVIPVKVMDKVVQGDVIPVKVMDKVVQGDVIPVEVMDKVVQGDVIPAKVVDKDVIPVKVMDKVFQGDVIPAKVVDKVVQGDVIPAKVVDKVVVGDVIPAKAMTEGGDEMSSKIMTKAADCDAMEAQWAGGDDRHDDRSSHVESSYHQAGNNDSANIDDLWGGVFEAVENLQTTLPKEPHQALSPVVCEPKQDTSARPEETCESMTMDDRPANECETSKASYDKGWRTTLLCGDADAAAGKVVEAPKIHPTPPSTLTAVEGRATGLIACPPVLTASTVINNLLHQFQYSEQQLKRPSSEELVLDAPASKRRKTDEPSPSSNECQQHDGQESKETRVAVPKCSKPLRNCDNFVSKTTLPDISDEARLNMYLSVAKRRDTACHIIRKNMKKLQAKMRDANIFEQEIDSSNVTSSQRNDPDNGDTTLTDVMVSGDGVTVCDDEAGRVLGEDISKHVTAAVSDQHLGIAAQCSDASISKKIKIKLLSSGTNAGEISNQKDEAPCMTSGVCSPCDPKDDVKLKSVHPSEGGNKSFSDLSDYPIDSGNILHTAKSPASELGEIASPDVEWRLIPLSPIKQSVSLKTSSVQKPNCIGCLDGVEVSRDRPDPRDITGSKQKRHSSSKSTPKQSVKPRKTVCVKSSLLAAVMERDMQLHSNQTESENDFNENVMNYISHSPNKSNRDTLYLSENDSHLVKVKAEAQPPDAGVTGQKVDYVKNVFELLSAATGRSIKTELQGTTPSAKSRTAQQPYVTKVMSDDRHSSVPSSLTGNVLTPAESQLNVCDSNQTQEVKKNHSDYLRLASDGEIEVGELSPRKEGTSAMSILPYTAADDDSQGLFDLALLSTAESGNMKPGHSQSEHLYVSEERSYDVCLTASESTTNKVPQVSNESKDYNSYKSAEVDPGRVTCDPHGNSLSLPRSVSPTAASDHDSSSSPEDGHCSDSKGQGHSPVRLPSRPFSGLGDVSSPKQAAHHTSGSSESPVKTVCSPSVCVDEDSILDIECEIELAPSETGLYAEEYTNDGLSPIKKHKLTPSKRNGQSLGESSASHHTARYGADTYTEPDQRTGGYADDIQTGGGSSLRGKDRSGNCQSMKGTPRSHEVESQHTGSRRSKQNQNKEHIQKDDRKKHEEKRKSSSPKQSHYCTDMNRRTGQDRGSSVRSSKRVRESSEHTINRQSKSSSDNTVRDDLSPKKRWNHRYLSTPQSPDSGPDKFTHTSYRNAEGGSDNRTTRKSSRVEDYGRRRYQSPDSTNSHGSSRSRRRNRTPEIEWKRKSSRRE